MKANFGTLLPHSVPDNTTKDTEHSTLVAEEGRDSAVNTRIHTRRAFPWTRSHSHFALMGGFAFDTSMMAVNILPHGRTRLTLTASALRELATNEPD